MQTHREDLAEKQRMLHMQDASKAAEFRQQERLRREAMQREANQRRREVARQRELDRRAGRPLTPWPVQQPQAAQQRPPAQRQPMHQQRPQPHQSDRQLERVEIPEQLF